MWTAQFFGFERPNCWLTSGALGLRCQKPEDLDPVITRMLDARGQVVADCRVR